MNVETILTVSGQETMDRALVLTVAGFRGVENQKSQIIG